MPRTRIEDRGFETFKNAGSDPMASFLIRIIGPGVRREVGAVRQRVGGFIDKVTDALLEIEGRPRESEIIDAEIVDDPSDRKKR